MREFAGPSDVIPQESFLLEESRLYDVGAEHSFLACIFKSNELIYEAERLVPPDWLYHSDHRYIYQIMLGHRAACEQFGWDLSFDHQYMLHVARQFGKACEERFIHRTDGMEKVRQLERKAVNIDVARFGIYAELIKDRSVRVQAYRQARQVQVQALDFEHNHSANAIAIDAESRFTDLVYDADATDESRIAHLTDGADWTLAKARLNAAHPGSDLFTVRCPFDRLNAVLGGGFHRKGLTLVCARPKTGKTTFLLNICISLAMRGVPALFIDNEMTREEVFTRELARVTGYLEQDIIAGKFFRDNDNVAGDYRPTLDPEQIYGTLEQLKDRPLYYVNVAGRPATSVLSIMRQFRQRHVGSRWYTDPLTGRNYEFANPAIVVYDWLKLPDASQLGSNRAEHQLLGFAASKVKDAATLLDLAVVAGAQQNREAVGASDDDFEELIEKFVATSDKLTQFCTALTAIRNVSEAEARAQLEHDWHEHMEAVRATERAKEMEADFLTHRWKQGEGRASRDIQAARLRYNQMLVVGANRKGPSCREGIPFYHDLGRFDYVEKSDPYTLRFRDAYRRRRKDEQKEQDDRKQQYQKARRQGGAWTSGQTGSPTAPTDVPQ